MEIKLFFQLLRHGLWATPLEPQRFACLHEEQWVQLMDMARRQALLALSFDAVSALPAPVRPPRMLYLQWAALAARVEQANRRLNDTLFSLSRLYQAHRLQSILLKGQGVGQNYRQPLHRQCGDIDLYLGPEGVKEATRLLLAEGALNGHEENNKHVGVRWNGVDIELHRVLQHLNSPLAERRFRRWARQVCPSQTEQLAIPTPRGEAVVQVLPVTFNVVYLFLHAFNHLLNGGIGLRQLCDWACLVHQRHTDIDREEVCRRLESLGLLRAAKAFGYIAVHCLGLPAGEAPFEVDDSVELGRLLLDDMMQAGNFGQHDQRYGRRPAGYWAGKWFTFSRVRQRCRDLAQFAPAEARWYPLRLVENVAYVQSRLWLCRLKMMK